MAPTKTATECDSGSVGRNFDSLTVGASAERAAMVSQADGKPLTCQSLAPRNDPARTSDRLRIEKVKRRKAHSV